MPRYSVTVREKSSGKVEEGRIVESTSEARVIAEQSAKGYDVESIKLSPDNFLGLDLPDPAAKLVTYHVTGKSKATGMRMEFVHKAPDEYALAADLASTYEIESCRIGEEKIDYASKIYLMILVFFITFAIIASCNFIAANSTPSGPY